MGKKNRAGSGTVQREAKPVSYLAGFFFVCIRGDV